MLPTRLHGLIAWFCLLWFGLVNTAFAGGGLVVCHDALGGSRVEWGCSRTDAGECQVAQNTADERGLPGPCRDTPIQSEGHLAKAPPRTTCEATALAPVFVPVLLRWDEPRPFLKSAWLRPAPERPPDPLGRLRTIILLV
jgi:hypothetical protein